MSLKEAEEVEQYRLCLRWGTEAAHWLPEAARPEGAVKLNRAVPERSFCSHETPFFPPSPRLTLPGIARRQKRASDVESRSIRSRPTPSRNTRLSEHRTPLSPLLRHETPPRAAGLFFDGKLAEAMGESDGWVLLTSLTVSI